MPVAPEYLHLVYEGPFPAYLYGRASRDPKKRGRSVGDQLDVGRELCAEHGWPIAGEFRDDDRSASRHARKRRDDFDAMVAGIERGECRILVAFEASRYYRDLEVYVRLRNLCAENDVLLCYNGTVYDLSKREDRKLTAQDAIAAEDEAEAIRVRNLRTTRAQAKKGAPHGRLLYGYIRRYDPESGDLIDQIPHPQQAAVVKEIWERAAAGHSNRSIIRDLNARGTPAPGSAPEWVNRHLHQMFHNPAYIGRRVFQGRDIGEATWKPLVEEETYWAVQSIIRDPDRAYSRDTAVRHLLTGIARCGVCEHAPGLRIRPRRGIVNYICPDAMDVVMRKEKLEAYVEEGVLNWLASPQAAEAFRVDRDQESKVAAARTKLAAMEAQLEEARAMSTRFREDGTPELSVASLAALEAQLVPQIESARKELEQASAPDMPPLLRRLIGQDDVDKRWDALTLDQKRMALRLLVTPRLNRARARGVRAIEPGRITLAFVGQPGFIPIRRAG